jgi:DNA-binding LacI/PurR family transcriptional regulator
MLYVKPWSSQADRGHRRLGGQSIVSQAANKPGLAPTSAGIRIRRPVSAPTMRDIADATGVSQSTVSRVLSGTPTAVPIAATTRTRVMEAAHKLGYRPNPLARGLRGAATMLLGVIVRDITDPFFAGAIEATSLEANRRGYNVVLGHAHRSADEAEALWAILEARHCDALLFLGDLRDRPDLIEDLQQTSIPVVALWHGSRESGIPTVSVDNRSGIAAVIDHLVGLGHGRIAFAGPQRLGDIAEREDAYLASAHGHGLVIPDEYRQDTGNDYDGGAAAFDRLMDLDTPPTAIVAPTDVIAMGMLHAAHRRGLRVPQDVSITGFDDIPVAAVSVPALTTVCMPTEAMILAALDLVIGPPEEIGDFHPILEPELVIRASSGPVPGQQPEGA